ncbi:hypothetical protein [Actinomadura sp. WMMA1423]|uniref:DUF6907 domain-containing protein n=1 Tax=Actinomadura sp. WMMA1423 TaxID=2591108 RepID=UPI0011473782|nr:hypothetical protein [Actinomadura sp. WMMA1423]
MGNTTDATRPQEAAEASIPGPRPAGEPTTSRAGTSPRPAPQTNDCPPWCTDHEDVMHFSADEEAGPMMARLYQTPGQAPEVDLVRDARRRDQERPLSVGEAVGLGKILFALAARAEAGTHTLAPSEAARPWWLPEGCPSWCEWPDDHPAKACYDDRLHTGESRVVVLTGNDTAGDAWEDPDEARMYIRQHYREVAPRIEVGHNDAAVGLQFTLDEAEEFAHHLLELAAIARTGNPEK